MRIRFMTKGEWISKYGDMTLYTGVMSTILGLLMTFGTEDGLTIGIFFTIFGIACVTGRIAFLVSAAKQANKSNLDKIMLICKCSTTDANLMYRYVQRANREGELYRATKKEQIVPILCQCTPYELHDKIPCTRLSDRNDTQLGKN